MKTTQLAEEALAWEWQKRLGLVYDPQPIVAWADSWILQLSSLPDALMDLSMDTRSLADTGPPLRQLCAGASWPATLPRFAESTLGLVEKRHHSYTVYLGLFDSIAQTDNFPECARLQFNAALTKLYESVGEYRDDDTLDSELFISLLNLWKDGV